jgi:membrane fusion protein, macrolide-specific efflux system
VNPHPVQTEGQGSADNASARLNGFRTNVRPGQPLDTGRQGQGRQYPERARRHIAGPQRAAAALIAGACLFGAAWYVPRIAAADGRSLSGTVTSTGVIYLNFSSSGQVAAINARVGEKVSKGQLLATEAAPAAAAVLAAERAAIAADKSELAAAVSSGSAAAADTARAQLARDQGQLAMGRADAAGTRIVAPSAGTVIAVNGQPGETADADGVHDYASGLQGMQLNQRPLFSLFPEGPQSSVTGSGSVASLPVIALRTSDAWQVTVLVPESSVATVRTGQVVTIDVPAAGISGVPGRVQELLATPVSTYQGTGYEAVVTVFDRRQGDPPGGMAANVELSS